MVSRVGSLMSLQPGKLRAVDIGQVGAMVCPSSRAHHFSLSPQDKWPQGGQAPAGKGISSSLGRAPSVM